MITQQGSFPRFGCALVLFAAVPAIVKSNTDFDLQTATIADINQAMEKGALSSEQLVKLSLARIVAYEPEPHAVTPDKSLNRHGNGH
jgi:amidase